MLLTPLSMQFFFRIVRKFLRDVFFCVKISGVVKLNSMYLNLVQKLTHKMWTLIHFLHNYGLFSNGDMHAFMFRLVVPLMCLKKYTCCDSDLNAGTFGGSSEWNEWKESPKNGHHYSKLSPSHLSNRFQLILRLSGYILNKDPTDS